MIIREILNTLVKPAPDGLALRSNFGISGKEHCAREENHYDDRSAGDVESQRIVA